jgi:hypothetical protein
MAYNIKFRNSNIGTISKNQYFKVTSDDGNTWVNQIVGINNNDILCLYYYNRNTICYGRAVCNGGWLINSSLVTNIFSSNQKPEIYKLSQNYPNTFNPSTKIKYQVKNNEYVLLKIYDINGKEIKTLVNEKQFAGTYEINFDCYYYPSGIYFYTLKTDNFKETRKMILNK